MNVSFSDVFGVRLMPRHEYNTAWSRTGAVPEARVSQGIYACRSSENIILTGGPEPGDTEMLIPEGGGTDEAFLENFKKAVKDYDPEEHTPDGGLQAVYDMFREEAAGLCQRYERCVKELDAMINKYWLSTQEGFMHDFDEGDVTYVKVAYRLPDGRIAAERHRVNALADDEYVEIEKYLRFICEDEDVGMESIIDIDLDF